MSDPRPTQKRQHRSEPEFVSCNVKEWHDVEPDCLLEGGIEAAPEAYRDAPPDAPAPLSHDAGEAVKRIIDSMEPLDAQPSRDAEGWITSTNRTAGACPVHDTRSLKCTCGKWPDAQPEAGEEIVLHRYTIPDVPDGTMLWLQCHKGCDRQGAQGWEHAVWTRRKP